MMWVHSFKFTFSSRSFLWTWKCGIMLVFTIIDLNSTSDTGSFLFFSSSNTYQLIGWNILLSPTTQYYYLLNILQSRFCLCYVEEGSKDMTYKVQCSHFKCSCYFTFLDWLTRKNILSIWKYFIQLGCRRPYSPSFFLVSLSTPKSINQLINQSYFSLFYGVPLIVI